MRKSTVLGILLALVFMTAGMGLPFHEGGKLALSNLTPLPFLALAGLLFIRERGTLDRRWLAFMVVFNIACCASFAIFLVRYRWPPNFPVLFFEDVELVFCSLLWWYGRKYPGAFRTAVKLGILASMPITALYGWHELRSATWFSAGMDDKSQGAVLLCCQAYVLIRFFGGRLKRLLGAGLYVASFVTVSRLPVFLAPAILIALMRRSRIAAFATLLAGVACVYLIVVAGNLVKSTFAVYSRLSSVQMITGSDSTEAHLQLLQTAVHIKFTDPWAFVFGIGPDNFSKALISSQVSIGKLESLDPELVEYALQGKAPLHSTPVQMLLDYNIGLFILFVLIILRAFAFLVRRRNMTDLFFAFGLLLAATFYSLHNKPYFYLYVTTVSLLICEEAIAETVAAAPALARPALEQG